jgi:hypothetical protein
MTERHVGLEPAPDDDQLEEWLGHKIDEASEEMEALIEEFVDVVKAGQEEDEPYLWSYARLLNHLATLDSPKMLRVLSAAIWTITEAELYGT